MKTSPACMAHLLWLAHRRRVRQRQLPHHLQRRLAAHAVPDEHSGRSAADRLLEQVDDVAGSGCQRVWRMQLERSRLAVVSKVQQQCPPGKPTARGCLAA